MCLFMVEEGASVAVGAPTQVTPAAGICLCSVSNETLQSKLFIKLQIIDNNVLLLLSLNIIILSK